MRLTYAVLLPALLAATGPVSFRPHTLATDLRGGYQVVAFDVNRDGKLDLIALASGMTELVWFEAPHWTRHVLARDLKRMINLAACPELDEIVVAHEFANVPKNSTGIVSVLTPGADRTQPLFAIGQRVLPAFCGMRLLYSKKLMFGSLALLNFGCVLRVASEVPAYEGDLQAAWRILPMSAMTELTAVVLFALNLGVTLVRPPPWPAISRKGF